MSENTQLRISSGRVSAARFACLLALDTRLGFADGKGSLEDFVGVKMTVREIIAFVGESVQCADAVISRHVTGASCWQLVARRHRDTPFTYFNSSCFGSKLSSFTT